MGRNPVNYHLVRQQNSKTIIIIIIIIIIKQSKKAVIYILYSYKLFGRTVNKKCLVSETVQYEYQLNCCEVRKVDDDYDYGYDDKQIKQYQQTDLIQYCMMTKSNTYLPIDIALPVDSDGNTKENGKQRNCKDLEIEFSRVWKVGTKIVPVVNWSIGNDYEMISSEPSVVPRSPVGHRATEGHINWHCAQRW
jgi:hypothetical protein